MRRRCDFFELKELWGDRRVFPENDRLQAPRLRAPRRIDLAQPIEIVRIAPCVCVEKTRAQVSGHTECTLQVGNTKHVCRRRVRHSCGQEIYVRIKFVVIVM